METLLATAFGRAIDIQRGQSDELTKAAATLFKSLHEGENTSFMYMQMLLSKFVMGPDIIMHTSSALF